MSSSSDVHVTCAKIQQEIENYLRIPTGDLIFEFQTQDNKVKLDLITINPKHNQSFLFHSVTGYDKVDVLNKMLDYIKNYKDKENHYTIQWMAKGEKQLHTSYFRASNVYDALDKLYYGRDIHTITVFSVTLNPVT